MSESESLRANDTISIVDILLEDPEQQPCCLEFAASVYDVFFPKYVHDLLLSTVEIVASFSLSLKTKLIDQ